MYTQKCKQVFLIYTRTSFFKNLISRRTFFKTPSPSRTFPTTLNMSKFPWTSAACVRSWRVFTTLPWTTLRPTSSRSRHWYNLIFRLLYFLFHYKNNCFSWVKSMIPQRRLSSVPTDYTIFHPPKLASGITDFKWNYLVWYIDTPPMIWKFTPTENLFNPSRGAEYKTIEL